jgi:hypothetical protein
MAGMELVVAGDGGGANGNGHRVVAATTERVPIVTGGVVWWPRDWCRSWSAVVGGDGGEIPMASNGSAWRRNGRR